MDMTAVGEEAVGRSILPRACVREHDLLVLLISSHCVQHGLVPSRVQAVHPSSDPLDEHRTKSLDA